MEDFAAMISSMVRIMQQPFTITMTVSPSGVQGGKGS